MNLSEVAYKNLRRKPIRTFLTVGGVAMAVAVLVGLMGFDAGYQEALQRDIDRMGYQVLVTAKGCPYEAATLMLKGGGGLRYMEQAVYEKIVKDERIDKITPQFVASVYDPDRLDGQGGFTLYMGIHDSFLELKPWTQFRSGGWFSSPDAEEVIMGYEAAEVEQRKVGDKVWIAGKDKVLTVAGIFERTGTQDDGVVFLPIQTAQTIFELPDQLTGIGIKLKDIRQLGAFEEDLYNEPGIQVISMAQVKGTIFNLVSSAQIMANSVAVIAILIAGIGVLNTILMSVFERTQEIGIMRAMGASRGDIFKIIWLETVLICGIGGLMGGFFAVVGTGLIETAIKSILPYTPSGMIVVVTWKLILTAWAGAVGVGIVAGIYPALRATFMDPVSAIRSEV